MDQEIDFPVSYSDFVRKRDAEYDGDPNGDYVLAEDVNELQGSIERLERLIDIEGLDETVSDALRSKLNKSSLSEFGSPLFINYNGSSIATYDTIEKRINAFSYIPHVMIKKETSSTFDFFIEEVKKSGTSIYGIISANTVDVSGIEEQITWFKSKGFYGVMLSGFGFESGWERSQQNHILTFIHNEGMAAVITGEIETTLFNKPHANNPLQENLLTSPKDIYLAQNIFVINGVKNNPIVIPSYAFNLNKAQKEKGIQIFVEDVADLSVDSNKLYTYGKMMSTLYNLDGYSLAPQSRFALNEPINRYMQGFELGQWKTDSPVFVEDSTSTSRSFSKGSIVFDKVKNECFLSGVGLSPSMFTWEDKQIPGKAIDMSSVEYSEDAVGAIVEGINTNDHLIHYSKIDGLTGSGATPDIIKDIVVRSINNSPAAVAVNGPGGFDAFAGNEFIHGRTIDWIDAGSIKTGVLNIEHIKTNIIEAINAYIGNAVIDKAFIGELSAEHIAANVVDAINLYAENAEIDKAYINTAVIGQLSADHIKGAVIEAVNLSAKEAIIDSAKIGQLTADHITASVVEAINLSAENAIIDAAKIGTLDVNHMKGAVVEAINLYAGNAKINYAQIGALKAENITAGVVEALEISASKAEFDSLKAGVISAINASLENAFIDGAIIDRGTIGQTQIADGSITDAKIVSLVANKIAAGTIDTGQVTLEGKNGHLRITGNRLQVFDDQEVPVERVSIGDVDVDGTTYGLRVRGADGFTLLYDENGVYSEGITDGAITNPKIQEGAIDGDKHIAANTITANKLVAESITTRELAAKSVNANHLQVGSIVAGSGVIGEGAIGEAEIGQASITTGHIKELDADVITAGSIKMTSRNLVSNASFKKGLYDWEVSSAIDLSEVSELVRLSGTNSAHIYTTGKTSKVKASIFSKFIPASEGEAFSASVYVMTKMFHEYDFQPQIELEFYNDLESRVGFGVATATLSENDLWQRISISKDTPSGATKVRIRMHHQQNGDSYFARPMLQRGKIVTEWTGDGSYMTEDGFYTGELHADQIKAGKISAEFISVGAGTNYEPGYSPDELREELEGRIPFRIEIISTNGFIFRNGQVYTQLTARVYKGSDDVTDDTPANELNWYRVGADGQDDTEWNNLHAGVKSVMVSKEDVLGRASFLCELV